MTWEMLERWMAALGSTGALDPTDPSAALHTLESAAERSPADRALARAIRALHDCLTAGDGLDPIVGGVHRERILAWSAWDATWIGVHAESGAEAVVRVLRRRWDDPVTRRALERDARALGPLVPGIRQGPGWIAAPLPGDRLPDRPTAEPGRLARLAATAIATLARYEAVGMWPVAAPEQWRIASGGIAIAAVEGGLARDAGPDLAQLARTLLGDRAPESALEEALSALALAPPRTAAVAAEVIEQALATDLAGRRHELFERRRSTARADRLARLLDAVQRMERAIPPPPGRGAVGVDLDGRTTAVETRTEGVWWGPVGEMSPVWTRHSGFDAPEARKLLRARAAAPPSERLQTEIAGNPSSTDAIGRWVAIGLKMRTVRLLLEKELGA